MLSRKAIALVGGPESPDPPPRVSILRLGDNAAMIRIDIRPVWRIRSSGAEREFDFQLVTILERLDATSKLTLAAEAPISPIAMRGT